MLEIAPSALEDARAFLESAGSYGKEGTGLLAGFGRAGHPQRIERFFAPDQVAGDHGSCWVEVTQTGKLQTAAELSGEERWIARIHSHPAEAFHSATDDRNPVLTADGAWSIVVPYFGLGLRHGIPSCAVLRRRDGRWQQLSAEASLRLIRVT